MIHIRVTDFCTSMDRLGYSRAHKTEPATAPATAAMRDLTSLLRRAAVTCRTCSGRVIRGTSASKLSAMMALFYCLCVAVLLLLSLPGPASAHTTAYAGWDFAPAAAAKGETSAKKSAASDWRAAHAQYAAQEDQDRYASNRPISSPHQADVDIGYGPAASSTSSKEGISASLRRLVLDGLAQAHEMVFGGRGPQPRATESKRVHV